MFFDARFTQGGARSSLTRGYFQVIPTGFQFGSARRQDQSFLLLSFSVARVREPQRLISGGWLQWPDLDEALILQKRTAFGDFHRRIETGREHEEVATDDLLRFSERSIPDNRWLVDRDALACIFEAAGTSHLAFAGHRSHPLLEFAQQMLHPLGLKFAGRDSAAKNEHEFFGIGFVSHKRVGCGSLRCCIRYYDERRGEIRTGKRNFF